jgi:hypothetical protein
MLPDPIASDPRLYAVLLVVLALAVVAQRFLPWETYATIHRAKTVLFPLLQPYVRVLLVSQKGGRDDAEYLTTIDDSVRGVWATLTSAGGSPHLICSVKARPHPDGGRQLSSAHVVWLHTDGTQTEAFLFRVAGGVDVYAHHETAVTDAEGHLSDPQTDGDVRGVVWDALADAYAVKESA